MKRRKDEIETYDKCMCIHVGKNIDGTQGCTTHVFDYNNLHRVPMAAFRDTSLYSRYILWVPLLELYLIQMPIIKAETISIHTTRGLLVCRHEGTTFKLMRMIAYLIDIKDLSGGLLHLSNLMHEIPEARHGIDLIGGKDLHAVSRRILVGVGGSFTPNHLVKTHL